MSDDLNWFTADDLTPQWRAEHVRSGDQCLKWAAEYVNGNGSLTALEVASAETLALIAQAHYQAANVRAKPTGPIELRTGETYVIPGVEGRWFIGSWPTIDMGAGEPTMITLYRAADGE